MMSQRHQDILTRNRVLLVRYLKVTNILLAYLREDYTLTDEMQQEIEAERISFEKVGALLDILVRRGNKAFDRFIRALAETDQDEIALALDENSAKKYINERDACRMGVQLPSEPNGSVSMATDSTNELQAVLDEINGKDAKDIMDIKLQPATNLHEVGSPMDIFLAMIVKWGLRLAQKVKIYQMNHLPRGRAVIINNRYFINRLRNRDGAQHDTENLKLLFEKLCFTVIIEENLTAQQIRDLLTAESQHQDHTKADAFVLFLLSHGNQGNIYGLDGEKLSIEDDITTLFDVDHCPALRGKPKIFFIQACQGRLRTEGYATDSDDLEPSELDENLMKNLEKLETVDKEGFVPGFHKKSDVVMSYATVKGYIAWRRSDVGSWFVRCLVSVFSRRAHSSHLIDMLTEVNFLLTRLQTSKHEGYSRQLAEKTDTLIKKLYFFPVSVYTSKLSEGSCEKV